MIEAFIVTAVFVGSCVAVCTLPEAKENLFPWDETDD